MIMIVYATSSPSTLPFQRTYHIGHISPIAPMPQAVFFHPLNIILGAMVQRWLPVRHPQRDSIGPGCQRQGDLPFHCMGNRFIFSGNTTIGLPIFRADTFQTDLRNDFVLFIDKKEIDRMTDEIPAQTAFILPGAPRVSSECHVARTICRRAERHAIAITGYGCRPDGQSEESPEQCESADSVATGIKYLNRLSDYLFTLGRYYCHKCGGKEIFWLP